MHIWVRTKTRAGCLAAKRCKHGWAAGGGLWQSSWGQEEPPQHGWTSSRAKGPTPVRMDRLPCQGGPPRPPHLYGGRCHLPSLVEVQRDDLGEAGGVAVHAGAAIAKSLQDGVESLPLLRCGKRSGAVGCRGCAAGGRSRHRWLGKRCCSCAVLCAAAALESAVKGAA